MYRSWLGAYKLAKEYYEEHGDLLIPQSYKVDGYNLGTWINNQRIKYKNNELSEEKIKLLEEINMAWNIYTKISWLGAYKLAKEYYEEHGNLQVPSSYKVNDYNLGFWINNQRKAYKNNNLSEEKINLLEEIDIVWSIHAQISWMDAYKLAKEYYEEYGNLQIPQSYKVGDYNLGTWINNQRIAYKNNNLSEEKINLLEEIDMVWNINLKSWLDAYKLAKEYYEEHGDLLIPQSYKVDGYNLGTWINNQRIKYKNNELSEEKIKLLEEINMVWNTFFSREIKPLNQNRIKLELLKELNKVLEEYKEDYIFDKKEDLEEINNNLILKLK